MKPRERNDIDRTTRKETKKNVLISMKKLNITFLSE